jgi:hypothetical protein
VQFHSRARLIEYTIIDISATRTFQSSCYQFIFSLFSFSAGITPSALPPPLPVATPAEVTRKRRKKATAEAEKKPEQDRLTQTAKRNARNMPVAAVPAAAAETAILGTAEKSSTI